MNKFLDPVANAKTLGFLLILVGIFRLLGGILSPINFIFGPLYIATGFGLRRQKLWAVYIIGILALLYALFSIYFMTQGSPIDPWEIGNILFNIGIFVWLYSAKKRFY